MEFVMGKWGKVDRLRLAFMLLVLCFGGGAREKGASVQEDSIAWLIGGEHFSRSRLLGKDIISSFLLTYLTT
jgi:hypothetical protein